MEASRPTPALSPQPYHHLSLSPYRHEGVFIVRGKEDSLVTRNFVPGKTVYNEKLVKVDVSAFHFAPPPPHSPLPSLAAARCLPAGPCPCIPDFVRMHECRGVVYSSTCPPPPPPGVGGGGRGCVVMAAMCMGLWGWTLEWEAAFARCMPPAACSCSPQPNVLRSALFSGRT